MAIYTQQINGSYKSDADGAWIPDSPDSRRFKQMLAEVAALESTQVMYAGSPQALTDAIDAKVLQLGVEFVERTGFTFQGALAMSAVFDVAANPAGADFTTNLNAYAAAEIVISAFVDAVAVGSYDVVATPSWSV